MLFGNQSVFGIEAVPLEVYQKWSYGNLRMWIGGHAIGDFAESSDLASSARWARSFLEASTRRTRRELDHLDAAYVYELLYGRFVQPLDVTVSKSWPEPWDRVPYVLDEIGEAALRDKYAVIAVRRGDGTDRIVVNTFEEGQLCEVIIPAGVCDRALESYCLWVEQLRA